MHGKGPKKVLKCFKFNLNIPAYTLYTALHDYDIETVFECHFEASTVISSIFPLPETSDSQR